MLELISSMGPIFNKLFCPGYRDAGVEIILIFHNELNIFFP